MVSEHASDGSGHESEHAYILAGADQEDGNQSGRECEETTLIHPPENTDVGGAEHRRNFEKLTTPRSSTNRGGSESHNNLDTTAARLSPQNQDLRTHIGTIPNRSYGTIDAANHLGVDSSTDYIYPIMIERRNKRFAINMKRYILSSLGVPNIPGLSPRKQKACSK